MPIQLSTEHRADLLEVLSRISGWSRKAVDRLDGEYSRFYVSEVAKGKRNNDEILGLLLQMAEEHREHERTMAQRIENLKV